MWAARRRGDAAAVGARSFTAHLSFIYRDSFIADNIAGHTYIDPCDIRYL